MNPARPLRIAITGGIGSGKSTAAAWFKARNALVIDHDEISRSLTRAGGAAIAAIERAFGSAMIAPDGALDRGAMRSRIFADSSARTVLERILHPMIRSAAGVLEREAGVGACVIMHDIPLLFEAQGVLENLAPDRILVIDCPPELQILRAAARASMPSGQVAGIILSQAARSVRVEGADAVILNSGTLQDFEGDLGTLWSLWALPEQQTAAM